MSGSSGSINGGMNGGFIGGGGGGGGAGGGPNGDGLSGGGRPPSKGKEPLAAIILLASHTSATYSISSIATNPP